MKKSSEDLNKNTKPADEFIPSANLGSKIHNGEITGNIKDVEHVLNAIGLPILIISSDLTIIYFNKQAETIFSLPISLPFPRITEITLSSEMDFLPGLLRNVMAEQKIIEQPIFLDKNSFLLRVSPWITTPPVEKNVGAVIMLIENTPQLFNRSPEGVLVTDSRNNIVNMNDAFRTITGYNLEEVKGKNPSFLQSGRQDKTFYSEMWQNLVIQGWWQGEIWNRRKNGEIYPEWLTINIVKDPAGEILNYIGIFSDISIIKESRERIEYLATHDALTDLPNRTSFMDSVKIAIARCERLNNRLALLFIDLDNFKVVNDSMGHDTGDKLLKEISGRLFGNTRKIDAVARFGGDEFALIIENAENKEVQMIVKRILQSLTKPVLLEGREVYPTASIGISFYPDDGADTQTLLKHADVAMYKAKQQGKNTYFFFSEDMRQLAQNRLNIENGLRHALEKEEFFLVFQPQYKIVNRTITGFEALIRWQHPELGLIMPEKFITIAEDLGLIGHVSYWVIDNVCKQISQWKTKGLKPPRISINISPKNFQSANLYHVIQNSLLSYEIDPSALGVEFTEGALLEDNETVHMVLMNLKKLGVFLSIDDFGTGYSSLSYLHRYALDELKIDRSFISSISDRPENRTLVKTIISIAKLFGLSVIAEGVETENQLNILTEEGCENVQGYLFSRPVNTEEVEKLLS